MAKPEYYIKVESGGGQAVWHGPYEVFPKNKLKSLVDIDPNGVYDYTVMRCQVVGVDWEKL